LADTPRIARPFLVFSLTVFVTAIAVFAYSWEAFPPQLAIQYILLAAAVLLSENYAFAIEPYSISLAFPMAMAAMVLGGPTWGIVIAALSFTNYRELKAHKPAPMVAFNFGQLVISSGVAGLTYWYLGGRFLQGADGVFRGWNSDDFPRMLLPMAAAAILCVTVNMLLTATAMGLIMRRPVRSTAATMLALTPTQLALAFVGYLIGETLAISALALPLFVAPLVVARQLYMRYVDMKGAFVDTVRSLVGALEAKDPYTRGHSERVAEYAAALARAHSLNPREIERLEYAALLHDLGKLSVPSSILVKPGRLEQEEMALIKEHPGRGGLMIGRIPPLKDLAEAVAQHHEWFDGTGYPNQIAGESQSLAARILAVADSFDAMTTTRAYRPALTHEQAVAELIGGAGTQFDPEVVRIFIDARVGNTRGLAEVDEPSHVAHAEPVGIGG
jgi:HD-GYP domain-containing protein (c-di-GMP phosphodiesterase class II)